MTRPKKANNWNSIRKAVFERDKRRCVNCLTTLDEGANLDPDHSVPRGVGGSDRLSNLNTLCRRCHKAKHGDEIAPTVEITSSGMMTDVEFFWYKHLLSEMISAMALHWDIRLIPKFGIGDNQAWYIPLGDLRRLDKQLLEDDIEYNSYQLEQYM